MNRRSFIKAAAAGILIGPRLKPIENPSPNKELEDALAKGVYAAMQPYEGHAWNAKTKEEVIADIERAVEEIILDYSFDPHNLYQRVYIVPPPRQVTIHGVISV